MTAHLTEWLSLALRWFHVIAGISWIGSSFYFMWLDANLTFPEPQRAGVEGELWMVHSGGFYQVEKRLIGPGGMPSTLHWFKWEAAFTWMSGICLLAVVYYISAGGALLTNPDFPMGRAATVGLSLGTIALAWLVYDLIWRSTLAERYSRAATALSLVLLAGVAYGLCQVFSGRAAFIHVGAMLGTIMVANVWVRILPAQRRMIAATAAGEQPDYTLGKRAKRRSVHNSYVTLPVVAIMLSNHYPMAYGGSLNWVILILLLLVGAAIRHAMILRTRGRGRVAGWWLAPAAAGVVALVWVSRPTPAPVMAAGSKPVSFTDVLPIVARRCQPCHSTHPTDDTFHQAPAGVVLETSAELEHLAPLIRQFAVQTKTMPLANKTGMTDAERALLGRWLDQLQQAGKSSQPPPAVRP